MKRILLLTLTFLIGISFAMAQPAYKRMMNDPAINFYDVVEEAESYFQNHSKGKGSGWKGYQRWKAENESKYYPSGDRSKVDPHFAEKAFQAFMQNYPPTLTTFNGGWRDLGPYDADSITSHYSPGIGRVECLWVNPLNDQHIYMGSRSGGFWRTTDGGNTWQNTTDFLVASGVNAIAVNPSYPDSVLINVRNGGNGATHGIYQSADGGLTWTQSNFNPTTLGWGGLGTNERIYKVAFHPTIPGLIFIGTSQGLYRSSNHLMTWTQPISPGWVTDIEFHPTDPNIVYAYDDYFWGLNQDVVMRSTNQGITFTQGGFLMNNSSTTCHLATSPDCPDCVYVGSNNGVWKSTNSAQTFSFLVDPGSSWSFAVSDTDDDFMIAGGLDLVATTNGGSAFNQVTWWATSNPGPSYVHADLRAAESVNGVFYVGTDGYLAKSTNNGTSWTRLNNGTGIRENYAVGLSQSNWMLSMSGSQDNGTSILDPGSWIEWNGGDGMEAIVHTLNDDWMIGSWQYGTRNRTKDGGQSRQGIGTPQSGSSQAYWIAPMFFDPNQQMRVFHFSDSLFSSEEFGSGWQYVGTPDIGQVKVAAIAENNSNLIIASRNDDIKLSQNGGQTWSDISAGLPGHAITDIAFDPRNDNTIVVTYNRHQNDNQKIFISHNLGATWTNITHNLGDMPIRTAVIDHTPAANIYVGTEIGVYYKPMSGTTWNAYNTNLPNVTVRDLEIQYASNIIKAATWGRGLWDYSLVGRKDYPAILTTNITHSPTEALPFAGVDQVVTSVISYDTAISSVFVKWSANGIAFNHTIPMANTVDSTWVSQSGISGSFPVGTEIFFKVFAIGARGDTTETYKYMYTLRPFGYCSSFGDMSFATLLTSVDFGDISNTSGKTQPYTDYTTTDSAVVKTGLSYDLTTHINTDGNVTIFAKAWIDWNQNGQFDDAGEAYDLGSATNTANGPTTLSPLAITIPPNALLGKTVMRVSAKYQTAPTACEQGFDGEVEDYAIIVETCAPVDSVISEQVCDSYTSPSGKYVYTTSGVYQDTLFQADGCDSLITINLTVSSSNTESFAVTTCNAYRTPSGNAIYTTSGVYTDTLLNAAGCDSVITIDLTIVTETFSNFSATACDSYTVPSGGETYTTSGIYQDTIPNVFGCDSIMTIDLTIQTVDTSLTIEKSSLTVNEDSATYQWMDCHSNAIMLDETGQVFMPIGNGSYAAIITVNGCRDTTECINMNAVGVFDHELHSTVRIYPNPSSGQFEVDLGGLYQSVQLEITDAHGKVIHRQIEVNKQLLQVSLNQPDGVYLINLTADGKRGVFKLLKE